MINTILFKQPLIDCRDWELSDFDLENCCVYAHHLLKNLGIGLCLGGGSQGERFL